MKINGNINIKVDSFIGRKIQINNYKNNQKL